MAWKAGAGRIAFGIGNLNTIVTNADRNEIKLPPGNILVVSDTVFKLDNLPKS